MYFGSCVALSCRLQLSDSEYAKALLRLSVYGRARLTCVLGLKNAAIDSYKRCLPGQRSHVVAPASAFANAMMLHAQT